MEELYQPDELSTGMSARTIGSRVLHFEQLTSTMDEARRQAHGGAPEGTVVLADVQTAGKGRLRRRWLTPRGNLAFSVVLYPEQERLPCLVMLSAVAVRKGIEDITGLKPEIKWPNDVLIRAKKVCGILCESDVRDRRVNYAIAGIGINLELDPLEFPDIAGMATSLSTELGRPVDGMELLRSILAHMDELYRLPPGCIFREWRRMLKTLGKRVRVVSGGESMEGVAEDVTQDGSLLLRRGDGTLLTVMAGDVSLRETKQGLS